jgi:hypothetical protein
MFNDSKVKTFKSVIHTKDEAKGIKLPLKILIFGYFESKWIRKIRKIKLLEVHLKVTRKNAMNKRNKVILLY